MRKIDESKIFALRDAANKLRVMCDELCDVRPELYKINRAEWNEDIENITDQIAAKQTLLFIGPFSSGKSSFINALLQEDVLPTSNRPCTSVVTELRFVDGGGNRGFAVRKDNEQTEEECDFNELLKMIDGPTGAIGESAAYHHIELYYDVSETESSCLKSLCRAGVTIVDCPGFGSPYYSNEDVVEEYLEKASHTFWINPVDRMGGIGDYKRLSEIKKKTTKLIPIMSKSDLIKSESHKEEIRDDYVGSIGSIFRSKEPIFCSAIKYKEGVEILKKSKKESLSDEEQEKVDTLFLESGISNVFAALIDSIGEKEIAESKVIVAYHDLTDLVSRLSRSADRELKYWRDELRAKGFEEERNSSLEDARELVANWIERESERVGKQLDNEITETVLNYFEQCGKDFNSHYLQDQVEKVWGDKISNNSRSWSERIVGTYKERQRLDISSDDKDFKLPSALKESQMMNDINDMRDIVFQTIGECGPKTAIEGGLGAVAISWASTSTAVWMTTGLATAIGVVGGVLIGVAAFAAIPVYTRHAKAKKDARLRDVEKKLKKWLESLRMGPSIHSLLSKQNEALFENLEKAQQKVAEELLNKKNTCERIKKSSAEIADSLKIQFANVK